MNVRGVILTLILAFGGQLFDVQPGILHAQETEAATRQYAVAVGFQNQKLYDAAIDEWQTFLKKFPDDGRVDRGHHYLGTCCLQQKRYPEAVAAFSTVVSKYPKCELLDQSMLNLGIAQFGQAQKSGKDQDYSKAEQAFGVMLAKFPDSEYASRALFNRAECLYQLKQFDKAEVTFADFVRKYPDSEFTADAMYSLGTAQETLKQSQKAAATFAGFVSKYPRHKLVTEVQMRQAELLYSDGKFTDARPVFEQVAKNREFELADVAMLRQARCLYEEGQLTEAARTYWNVPREFTKTKHYDAAILAGAKCYFLEDKFDLARTGLEKLVDRKVPEAAEATQWLARAFLKSGDAKKALEVADRGLGKFQGRDYRPELEMVRLDAMYEIPQEKPKVAKLFADFAAKIGSSELAPQALYMAALTSLEIENHANGKKYGQQFLKQFGSSDLKPDILFVLAESELLLREPEAAVDHYRQFLAAAPAHANAAQAQVRLGVALHMAGDHAGAVKLLTPVAAKLSEKSLRSEAYGVIGRSEAAQQHFGPAVELLRQAIAADPDRPQNDETHLAMAEALRELGRANEADAVLQKLITSYPNSRFQSDVHFRLGEAAYKSEKFNDAIRYYKDVVAKWPASDAAPYAQYGLCWSFFDLGEFSDAASAVTELLKRYPNSKLAARSLYVRALAYYQLGEFQNVLRDIDAYLATKPDKSDALDALYAKGLAQNELKQFAAAAKTYADILTQGKDYSAADKAAYELGWTLTELGKADESVATFRRLANDWPDSPFVPEGLFLVAEASYQAEKYDEAAEIYREAAAKAQQLKVAGIGEQALHKLGWSYMKTKNIEAAAGVFADQLKQFPAGEFATDARFLVGECHFQNAKWPDALQAYRKVIDNGASNYVARAMFRSGECAANLEDWNASRTWHQKVLDAYPDFDMRPEARYGLAWALQNEGNFDNAIRQYELVTEETDTATAAKARFMIGECCFAQKKHEEATKHFLKTAFLYGHPEWSAMAYFEAGRCFEVMRNTEQARACYEKLVSQYPQHKKTKDAERRLAELKGS